MITTVLIVSWLAVIVLSYRGALYMLNRLGLL